MLYSLPCHIFARWQKWQIVPKVTLASVISRPFHLVFLNTSYREFGNVVCYFRKRLCALVNAHDSSKSPSTRPLALTLTLTSSSSSSSSSSCVAPVSGSAPQLGVNNSYSTSSSSSTSSTSAGCLLGPNVTSHWLASSSNHHESFEVDYEITDSGTESEEV